MGETLGDGCHDLALPRRSLRERGLSVGGGLRIVMGARGEEMALGGEWARQDSNLEPRDYESPGKRNKTRMKWPSVGDGEGHFG